MKSLIRGFLAGSCSDHVTIITCPGTGQKFGALEPRRCLEMSTMLLLASRGQVELFGEQPTRGPTVSFLSLLLFFFLAFVSHPPPRRFLFLLFLFSICLRLSVRFSLFSTFSFARLVHSYSAASSATSGPGDEEGPSGPIYPRASCDDPVDGFQKYTVTVLN